MTANNYPRCLGHLLKFEGGYVDHPRDPGGATNMGITLATLSAYRGEGASKADVRNLTEAEAAAIYRRNYWNAIKGDYLADGLDLVAFDGGVNSGPSRGAKWLQKGLRVSADGKVGPRTLDAAEMADGKQVIKRACAARMGFLRGLSTFDVFGRGWSRRVASVEALAMSMYTRSAIALGKERRAAGAQAKGAGTTAGGAASGGGAASFADLPDYALYGVIALAVIVALIAARKAMHHRDRAAAYEKQEKELAHG